MIKPMDLNEELGRLTPVEKIGEIFYKRDDMFTPFGIGSVNGGKLRQCCYLLMKAKEQGYGRVLTGCSILSPQAPIAAATAQHLGMECIVYYGGTNEKSLEEKHMPRLVKYYGSEMKIVGSGRHNVLYAQIKKDKQEKDYVVEYGLNSNDSNNFVSFYESTGNQVKNLPDELDNLIITCGSGITSAGILYGLKKYNKSVKNIFLVGTAPNRIKKVKDRLLMVSIFSGLNCNIKFNYIDLFGEGVKYEMEQEACVEGEIKLHKHYEGKSYIWFLKNKNLFNEKDKTCFWIIGSEPTLLSV